MQLSYHETPIQELRLGNPKVRVLVKREDQNHPHVSGNKWWKLKHNLEAALAGGYNTVLTFGGAFSNHLYATAAAARELGLKSIGIVRGEEVEPLNPTLAFARSQGMRLEFVSRDAYRQKNESEFIKQLQQRFTNFYLMPEGGTNPLAVKGCEELGKWLSREAMFDAITLPVGTGGTLAGLVNSLPGKSVLGFSSLKSGSFLKEEVRKYLSRDATDWAIVEDFHFGGYGKITEELKSFIVHFEKEHGIPLDPVYTGKMMFGLVQMIKGGKFADGTTILALHTGGLQGRKGFNF
ncbi:MAG: 1-aminocyclopropane-1-carboxylate deaminase/D-cysteine desulfhydrase [Cyclobacteriaceae bacterium]